MSVSPWDLLSDDLIREIITPLCLAQDKTSLDSLMQTSWRLRVLSASSPWATLAAKDPQCMERFPSHTTQRVVQISMEPRAISDSSTASMAQIA